MQRLHFGLYILVLSLTFSLPTYAFESPQAEYQYLITVGENNTDHLNAWRIRELFPLQKDFKPYEFNSTKNNEYFWEQAKLYNPKLKDELEAYSKRYFALPAAHGGLAKVYKELGDETASKKHAMIGSILFRTLFMTGNGKSPETAFRVLNVPEEYMISHIFLKTVAKQRTHQKNGHMYDILQGPSRHDGKPIDIWFDITDIFKTLP